MPSEVVKASRAATQYHTPFPKTCPNPSIPKPATLAPLGTLSILPRELRDHIYSHVCDQGYSYSFMGYSRYQHRYLWMEFNFPMLRVCRAIREEFFGSLFSNRFFEIKHHVFSLETQRSHIPFLNDISKVRFVLDLYYMSDDFKSYLQAVPSPSDERELLSAIKAEPVSFFTGTSVMRKECVIELCNCRPTSLLTLLSSPLMHAMCQLTGFTTVQLDFSTYANRWLKDDTPQHIRKTFCRLGTCPGFDNMVLRVISTLEPSLGSFAGSRLDKSRPWNQRVTFHPRDHPTGKVEELGAKSSTEMEEEILEVSTNDWTKDYHR